MRLLTRASARYFRHHRSQLLFSVLGVALGVAVVLSIDLAIQSARTAFLISAEMVAGRATHQIARDIGSLDETLLRRLRVEVGIHESAPVVEGFASSPLLEGQALRILGIDPFSEAPFRSFVAAGSLGIDVSVFVTTHKGIILSAVTAARAGVRAGDSLPVLVGGEAWRLPVVGTLAPSDRLARVGLVDMLVMDIAGAQDVLHMRGRLTRIDLRVPDSARGEELLAAVRDALAPDESLLPVGTRAKAMSGMIAAFDTNLTALSLLGMIFGMFLIYNAVTFSVVQRRALLGRLRAIGVTRLEILRLILAEAACVGIVGTAVGLGAGILLARGLTRLVTRTINDLYFTVSVENVSVEPIILAKAVALGLAATILAALPPAVEAAVSEPRLAMIRSISEAKARQAVPRAAVLGGGLAALGTVLLALSTRSTTVSFIALFLIVVGLALLTPLGTVLLVGLANPLFRRVGGMLGLMASRAVVSTLSRTAPAIAALVVAVSVTVGLGVMIQSFRGTLTQWLDGTLRADVYISLPGPTASRASGTLWPELIESYVTHPRVVGYTTYRGIDVAEEDGRFRLVALDLDPRGEAAFSFLEGDAGAVMRAFQEGEGVIVSEPYAFHRKLGVGDRIRLTTRSGVEEIPILGVFYDYGSDRGTVMMDREIYDRLFDDSAVTSLGLFLEPGADSDTVVRDLLASVPEGRTVLVRTNDSLRAASLELFERTFEVTAVLRLLAFVVAFVGVLSALMALELERAREFGVLRASGLTPVQIWTLVVAQTGLMGFVAGVLAVPMGIVLSVVMIFVINKRSFGWTLEMQVGPDVLLQAMALAVGGALLAGLYPAWRMSRTSPSVALRSE